MRTMTAFVAAAALVAGMSIAGAQNAPTTNTNTPPNSINKGSQATKPSGAESERAAQMKGGKMANQKVAGKSKFCLETSPGGALNCKFASMSACQKAGKAGNKQCVTNPKMGTTGAK